MAETKLEKYLYQLRRIEEHREAASEKEIRKIYKKLLNELQAYLSEIYITYSEDDMLNYGNLAAAGMDARFLEEVEQRINGITPEVAREITTTVQDTYAACYNGMQGAVVKAAGDRELLQQAFSTVKAVTPDIIKQAVNNPVSGLTLKDTLEKHRKDIIYDIKRNIGVGLSNGDRFSTMAKRISESLDGDYKKSIRVVRTEAHRVRESGYNDAATDLNNALKEGVTGMVMAKTWHTMKDERVRPNTMYKTKNGWKRGKKSKYNHEAMDGVTIPQDELFKLPSGAECDCPSKTGVAGEDINCRCYVSYDLVKASELTKVKDGTQSIEKAVNNSKEIEPPLNFKDSDGIFDDRKYNEYLRESNRNLNITSDQREAIQVYTGKKNANKITTGEMNNLYRLADNKKEYTKYFRKKKYTDEFMTELEKECNDISTAIKANKVKDHLTTYRAVANFDWLEIDDISNATGSTFMSKGFTSSAIEESKSWQFNTGSSFGTAKKSRCRMEIDVPKGSSAMLVDAMSEYKGETELLIDKNSMFEILGYEETDYGTWVDKHMKVRLLSGE